MKFLVQVICVSESAERRQQVFEMERENLTMETLGLSLGESNELLRGVQEFVVAEQVAADLEQRRKCPHCGKRHASKAQGSIKVKTVFGQVEVPNPRWHRCLCQSTGPSTFRPMTSWLAGQTSPELLYLETKWASLIPYAKVAELLKDVLPVAETLNRETVHSHLQAVGNRIERELGEESVRLFEGSDEDWEEQPPPDGPMTVGIDGGLVRAAHKEGWFEVIAGKSVVAFRREETDETPVAKCFGFVQTYDEKPRRHLWELLKSQGMQENQQVVFLSDGGDTVRQLQEYLHPCSEHFDRLVPHHDAAHSAPTASERVTGRTAAVWPRGGETAREREALALARQHRRGARTHRRTKYRTRPPSSVLIPGRQTRQEPRRVRNLHPKQHRIHSELRGTLPAGRNDQYRVCRIDD